MVISLPGAAGCRMLLLARRATVAILAQGTSWAVAVMQAFLVGGSIPGMLIMCVMTPGASYHTEHNITLDNHFTAQGVDAATLLCLIRVLADGHTASNAPDLFRPPKLSGAGPG